MTKERLILTPFFFVWGDGSRQSHNSFEKKDQPVSYSSAQDHNFDSMTVSTSTLMPVKEGIKWN